MLARIFNPSMYQNILLLLTFFILQCNYAQEISVDVRDRYLEEIKNEMWNIFKDYGLSNLPVPDFQVNYNKTNYYGYTMLGTLYLKDGFVLDASNFELDEKKSVLIIKLDTVIFKGKIDMKNILLFQDFKIDFEKQSNYQDKANGSILLESNKFNFEFSIEQNFQNMEIKSYLTFIKNINPYIEFNPDNSLTSRVKKLFFEQIREQKPGKGVLEDLCSQWQDILNGFLKEAVARCQFPDVKFRLKKN